MTWVLPIFTLLNLILAFIDSRVIGKGRRILHGVNGLIYLSMVAAPVWLFHNYWLIGALAFNRAVVFNIALSLFRGSRWKYLSPKPKAITDRIALFVFGRRPVLMYTTYLLIFITFTILCYAS